MKGHMGYNGYKEKTTSPKLEYISETKGTKGLGIQKCTQKNKALMTKLACRIYKNPIGMWATVLLNKYNNRNFISDRAKTSKTSSNIWTNILADWEVCTDCSRQGLGNRVNIRFWKDNWIINSEPLATTLNTLLMLLDENLKVARIIRDGEWTLDGICDILPMDNVQKNSDNVHFK